MAIYLVDEPFAAIALSYAAADPSAKVVLLQDGVYVAKRGSFTGEVFYVQEDAASRGLGDGFPPGAHAINFDKLVAMLEQDRIVNFL